MWNENLGGYFSHLDLGNFSANDDSQ